MCCFGEICWGAVSSYPARAAGPASSGPDQQNKELAEYRSYLATYLCYVRRSRVECLFLRLDIPNASSTHAPHLTHGTEP